MTKRPVETDRASPNCLERLVDEVIEFELAPQLDLPSALSFSFTCKRVNALLATLTMRNISTPLTSSGRTPLSSTRPPFVKIALLCSQLGYDKLLVEFFHLYPSFFRYLPLNNLELLISEAIRNNHLHVASFLYSSIGRVFPPERTFFSAAGRSGAVSTVLGVLDLFRPTFSSHPTIYLKGMF